MSLHSILLWSLVAAALVAGLAYLAGRAVGQWLPRDDPERAGTRARRSLWVLVPLTYVAALFAMTAAGWLDLTDRALAALPTPGPVEGFLGLVLAFGVPALAVVAPYLGLFPAVREARDIEMTTGAVALTLVRYLVGLVALLAAALLATGGMSVVAGRPVDYSRASPSSSSPSTPGARSSWRC